MKGTVAIVITSVFFILHIAAPVLISEEVSVKIGFEGHEVELKTQPGSPGTVTGSMPQDGSLLDRLVPQNLSMNTVAAPAEKTSDTGGKVKSSGEWAFKQDGFELPQSSYVPGDIIGELTATGRVALYGITFAYNSTTIKNSSVPTLNKILKLLQSKSDINLIIEGHTCNSGDADNNFYLSQDRADSVKSWLTSRGIDSARLRTQGFGEARPIAGNDTEEGKARNRRVEIVIQK